MLKRFVCTILIAVCTLSFCACTGSVDSVDLKKESIPVSYTAVYAVSTESFNYENEYTVSVENGELLISSLAEMPYEEKDQATGEQVKVGTQSIKTEQRLGYNENLCVPIYSFQEFVNSAKENQYMSFTFEHDRALKSGIIKTRKYSESGDNGFDEKIYSVKLAEQYFDKDALPFIIAAFPESGTTLISSGNRDRLQTVHFEFEGTEEIQTASGENVLCKKIILRPNTVFTSSKAYIWVTAENGIPVKIESGTSVMLIKSVRK